MPLRCCAATVKRQVKDTVKGLQVNDLIYQFCKARHYAANNTIYKKKNKLEAKDTSFEIDWILVSYLCFLF